MPTRTASFTKRIAANGHALHRAMQARTEAGGDAAPSDEEAALLEQRRLLKEEREQRKAQALQPRKSAVERLVRTHHPEAKAKAKKESHAEDVKKPKARRSRAEKHAQQAAAQEAARHTRSTAKAKPAGKPAK